MLKINQTTIENVSIKDLKETEEVLKLYNNHIDKPEEERKTAVIEESRGKLTEKEYDERINHAKSFTMEEEVPTPADWAQIRTLYRELGNQKIADARTKHESVSKEYTGMATINDERYGNISPRQAVVNYESARRKVETTKKMGVLLSLGLGIIVFLAILTVLHFVLFSKVNLSPILVQIVSGVAGLAGLILGGYCGRVIINSMLKKQKEERDYFEVVASNNREVITKLQMAIKSSEENIKRIEAQYGVEILAKTDFSDLVTFNKKAIKVEKNEENSNELKTNVTTEKEPEIVNDSQENEMKKESQNAENAEINDVKPAKEARTPKSQSAENGVENADNSQMNEKVEEKKPKKRTKKAE